MATYEAPTVQSLGDIMQELQPAVQGQVDVINAQKEANAGIYEAQRAGLDATKTREFNTINTQATGRGMTFSGIPLNEQAEYLSTKYLPGVQASHAQQNADSLAYDRQAADLNANIFNKAFDWRNQQVLTLNDWNKMLAGQEWQTGEREAGQKWQSGENVLNREHQTSERVAGQDWQSGENRLNREHTSSENKLDREFQASQNAASRAASAAYGGSGGDSGISFQQSLVSGFQGYTPHYEGGTAYYTEREIIPALAAAYPNMSLKDIKSSVYGYRQQVYGEGAGK